VHFNKTGTLTRGEFGVVINDTTEDQFKDEVLAPVRIILSPATGVLLMSLCAVIIVKNA